MTVLVTPTMLRISPKKHLGEFPGRVDLNTGDDVVGTDHAFRILGAEVEHGITFGRVRAPHIYTVENYLGILTITRFFSTSIVIFCLSIEAGIATIQKYPLFSLGDTA